MSIRDNIPDDIRRASKMIGLALWLADPESWIKATTVLALRLTEPERKALAYAALLTLEDHELQEVLDAALGPEQEGLAA